MIDFRYHLVSLISVFLALAVGIALGAGPLKEAIGDTLTGQVEQLRSDRENLRADLKDSRGNAADQKAFIEATSGELLEGTLTGQAVALVVLPGAADDDVKAVTARITQAGGTVAGTATVLDAWSDSAKRAFRQELVSNVIGYIAKPPKDSDPLEQQLGAALVAAFAQPDTDDAKKLSERSLTIASLLTTARLVEISRTGDGPYTTATGLVIISGDKPTGEAADDAMTAYTEFASESATRVPGTVVAGPSDGTDDLVSVIRGDDELAKAITTVDGLDTPMGAITAALAVASAQNGTVGQYGMRDSAKAVVPAATEGSGQG